MKFAPLFEETLRGYTGSKVDSGESGAKVYRFTRRGRRALYLKYGSGHIGRQIVDEAVRLEWLNGYLPSPRVRQFGREGKTAWMLSEALAGRPAYECLVEQAERRLEIARAMGSYLRRFHALPVEACPFQAEHRLRMIEARRNVEAGVVDVEDFDEERQGWTAEQVWADLQALMPARFERVVTHGDFSLDNIFLEGGSVTGTIDVGRLGIADPYQDLAVLWSNLAEFGAEVQRAFLAAYGVRRLDRRKLDFHLCLDELF